MAKKKAEKMVLLVVQQGGSTKEMYLHTFNEKKDVRNYKRSCDRASYNTSPAISVPVGLEKYIDDIDKIVTAALNLALPW